MNAIIIISDDPCVTLIKDAIQPFLITKVCAVSDFDAGLNAIFEKQPLVVFIQDEINGINGETVSHHVKSLLQANSPRFITLDRAAVCPGLIRDFSDGINLNHPFQELVAIFNKHLLKIPGLLWTGQCGFESLAPSRSSYQDVGPLLLVIDPFAHEKSEVPTETPSPTTRLALTGEAPLSRSEMTARECLLFPEIEIPPWVAPAPALDPEPDHPRAMAISFQAAPFPAASVPRKPETPHGRRRAAQALLICGSTLFFFCSVCSKPLGIPPSEVPSPAPSSPPQVAPLGNTLPSFIPKEGLDPAYGAVRPGWERYLSSHREYFIFREKGVIRVLQIVALKKEAITPHFVSSLLGELCGAASTVMGSKSVHNGYLIQRGVTSTKAEVTYYRRRETGEIRGIVITLP